jgi:hypothetical protein
MRDKIKEYRKTATVKAKIFEKGDEDGMEEVPDHYLDRTPIPYISTLENQKHQGKFGGHYVCIGINNERWLVEKDIFERTYEVVESSLVVIDKEKLKDIVKQLSFGADNTKWIKEKFGITL